MEYPGWEKVVDRIVSAYFHSRKSKYVIFRTEFSIYKPNEICPLPVGGITGGLQSIQVDVSNVKK